MRRKTHSIVVRLFLFVVLLLLISWRFGDAALFVRRNESARASLAVSRIISTTTESMKSSELVWHVVSRSAGLAGDVIHLIDNAIDAIDDAACALLFGDGARVWHDLPTRRRRRQQQTGARACVCPTNAPAFRHDIAECVSHLGECANSIAFSTTSSRLTVYAVGVPRPNGANASLFADDIVALWKESAVKVQQGVGPRCKMLRTRYFDAAGWHTVKDGSTWFILGWDTTLPNDGRANIFWNGEQTQKIANKITGAIIVMEMACGVLSDAPTHCLMLRVEGQLANPRFEEVTVISDASTAINDNNDSGIRATVVLPSEAARNITDGTLMPTSIQPQGRLETMLIIVLAILLFLSVISSVILWNICWRIKKSELISSLQMQFLYHIKQEKEKAACAAAASAHSRFRAAAAVAGNNKSPVRSDSTLRHYYGGTARSSLHDAAAVYDDDEDDDFDASVEPIFSGQLHSPGYGMSMNGSGGVIKRKLYFSAEFFDPFFMANPPPMAEQFLQDLRKMIAIAKQRIAQKRHFPQLPAIREEDDEDCDKSTPRSRSLQKHRPASTKQQRKEQQYQQKQQYIRDYESAPTGRPNHILGTKTSVSPVRRPMPDAVVNGSPKSAKSGSDDSGNDTFPGDASSSASSSSGEDAESCPSAESASPAFTPPPTQRTAKSPSQQLATYSPLKQQHFLPLNGMATSTHRQNPCYQQSLDSPLNSRIPVSKSPRLQHVRPFLSAAPTPVDNGSTPSSDASNYYHQVAPSVDTNATQQEAITRARLPPPPLPPMPPPLPASAPPPAPLSSRSPPAKATRTSRHTTFGALLHPNSAESSNTPHRSGALPRRQAYAVFPSDSILKKSLPRRSKKSPATNVPGGTTAPTHRSVAETRI